MRYMPAIIIIGIIVCISVVVLTDEKSLPTPGEVSKAYSGSVIFRLKGMRLEARGIILSSENRIYSLGGVQTTIRESTALSEEEKASKMEELKRIEFRIREDLVKWRTLEKTIEELLNEIELRATAQLPAQPAQSTTTPAGTQSSK